MPKGCSQADPSLLDIPEPPSLTSSPPPSPHDDFSDSESNFSNFDYESDDSAETGQRPALPTYCAVNLRNIWRSAIVELGVLYHDKGESLPDGWEQLPGDVSAGHGTYNTSIIFKRRGSTGRPDHITDLQLVYKGMSKVPPGYTTITKTISYTHPSSVNPCSYDANLNRGTYSSLYLCYKRNSEWDPKGKSIKERARDQLVRPTGLKRARDQHVRPTSWKRAA